MELTPPPAGFEAPRRVFAGPRLTERWPQLFPVAVLAFRARQRMAWLRASTEQVSDRRAEPLAYRVKKHASLLMRELSQEEMHLQRGKVVNLRLASAQIDTILLQPGQTFSFNRVVGNCTRRKGYVEGMRLSNGSAHAGVGGGICQLANLLHWMVLHSELTILERSEHSFDPFPDKERVLPWGVGCSIVYNYVDLVVRNDTEATFQVFVHVGDRHLHGELRTDRDPTYSYRVRARDECFIKSGDDVFRRNEIWRTAIDRRTGQQRGQELMKRNCALVTYEPVGPVIDCSQPAVDAALP
ncbi:MAG: VanW family protein [Lapillicoccus sp.]